MTRAAGAAVVALVLVVGCTGNAPAPSGPVPSSGASVARSPSAPPALATPSLPPVASPGPLTSGPPAASGSIAYVLGTGPKSELQVVAPTGATIGVCGPGTAPAWSTDGSAIVYARPGGHDADGLEVPDVYRAGADCATSTSVIANGDAPHFAPDGAWVTFGRGVIDAGDAWIAAADGTAARMLAPGTSPTWSPDGSWLLFNPASGAYELGLIRPDGSGYRSLGLGLDASWTPDGRIVHVLADATTAATSLRVTTLDGTTEVLVTSPIELRQPRMTADGRVVFLADGDVWRLDPGSTRPVRLTQGLRVGAGPSLASDGRWAAVSTTGDPGLVAVSLEGGWTRLVGGPVSDVAWQPVAVGP